MVNINRASFAAYVVLWVTCASAIETACADERPARVETFLTEYCIDCHSGSAPEGDIGLEQLSWDEPESAQRLERALRRINTRQMPPADAYRPSEEEYQSITASMSEHLADRYARQPNPGRVESLRRMSRTEYGNAIRDLLKVEIEPERFLPADESSHGFDHVTVGELTPTLINRYLSAAQKISRLAVGIPPARPGGDTFRVAPDVTQENHINGLPLGTRGGLLIPYTFPCDGEFKIEIRLARDRNEEVEGLRGTHELTVLLDRRSIETFTIRPPKNRDHTQVDAHLHTNFAASAGPTEIGVTFLETNASLIETMRQPFDAHFNMHRHPRQSPAVYQVSITGPYDSTGKLPEQTPSRAAIFVSYPNVAEEESEEETECAEQILRSLTRRAYRRPTNDADIQKPMEFYRAAREAGQSFDEGIEAALSSILINPNFLFRIERTEPQSPLASVQPGEPFRISDIELASRLSFFLWSSIPDEELLRLAENNQLHQSEILSAQVSRMLADPRSQSLVTNFAAQWLYLRNLASITPDMRLFPDFDDNLRQAFRTETELLFEEVMNEDRSVLDLISADFTYLNERLAAHYGIPNVFGSRFRRVPLDPQSHRGGLLRHGSILTVTSYATRTSPVIRGHWILKNFVGAPPPPPPPNIPALEDNTVDASLSMRELLAVHRANEACASCHNLMDPIGFTLENFDAVGRYRDSEEGLPIDASGGLGDGSEFTGVEGLEAAMLRRPELFVQTMTEKLLVFALGRGLESHDGPVVRNIVSEAAESNYRFSSIIQGIVASPPFQMRSAE